MENHHVPFSEKEPKNNRTLIQKVAEPLSFCLQQACSPEQSRVEGKAELSYSC